MADQPVRSTLSGVVQSWASDERIQRMLDRIEDYEKKARFNCQHCKKINYVDIPDDVKQLEALLKLIEQTEGKPGTVDGEPGGTTIIVERIWPGEVNGDSTSPGEIPAPHTADDLPPEQGEG